MIRGLFLKIAGSSDTGMPLESTSVAKAWWFAATWSAWKHVPSFAPGAPRRKRDELNGFVHPKLTEEKD